MDTDNPGTIAAWLQRELRRREWTQTRAAERVGVAVSVFNRWFNGAATPEPPSCDLLADTFGTDGDYVLALAGHRPMGEPIEDTAYADIAAKLRRLRILPSRETILHGMIDAWIAEDRADVSAPSADDGRVADRRVEYGL